MSEVVVVRPSTLPGAGDGLFALEDIPQGERFIEYYGKVLSFKQAKEERNRNYMKVVSLNKHIDAADPTISSKARYINDCPDASKINCRFVIQEGGRVFVETTKLVCAGEELFVAYGRGHWLFCEEPELALAFLQLRLGENGRGVWSRADFKAGEYVCTYSSLHTKRLFAAGLGVQMRQGNEDANCKLRNNPVLTGTVLVECTRAIVAGEELVLERVVKNRAKFFLTAFGRFAGVESNPTMLLLDSLKEQEEELGVLGMQVFETSIPGVREGLDQVQARVGAVARNRASSLAPIVYVHFGVHQGSTAYKLERLARNCANFGVADESGLQPKNSPINTQFALESTRQTRLDLDALSQALNALGHAVSVSHDCGGFVCNYAYYSSLQRISVGDWGHDESLFVHVPSLGGKFTQEAQAKFARDLLCEIANTLPVCRNHYNNTI